MSKTKNETWSFSAEMIRLAAIWKEAHPKYPAARFVHAEPHPKGGAYICGTDGHAMLIAYDRKAKCPSACNIALPSNIGNSLIGTTTISRKVHGPRDKLVISEEGTDDIEFTHAWILPGIWLNWRGTLPTPDQFNLAQAYTPRVLNATYLKRIGMMYDADTMADHRQVHFATKGLNQSVFAFFPWNRDVFLIVAPMMAADAPRLTFPEWLAAEPTRSLDDAAADL